MRCDECREAVVRGGGAGGDVTGHAAGCAECRAWIEQEVATMSVLNEAGKQWREGPVGSVGSVGPVAAESAVGMARRFRPARWVAAAAVVALAAGGVLIALRPSPANAMEVMLSHVKSHGSVRFRMEIGGDNPRSGTFIVQGSRVRVDADDGLVFIADGDLGKRVVLNPARHELIRGDRPTGMPDMYGLLMALGETPRVEELGLAEVEGRAAEVYRAQLPAEMDAVPGSAAKVWLDAATRLPLRVEIPSSSGAVVTLGGFVFDEPVGSDLFDTEPAGYTEKSPEPTTPGIGPVMASRIRQVGMAFQMYLSEHEDVPPERIEDLARYLPEGGLKGLRRPAEEVGYVYVKPSLPLNGEHVLLYERFAEGSESLWVVMVNGSSQVKTRAELDRMLAEQR